MSHCREAMDLPLAYRAQVWIDHRRAQGGYRTAEPLRGYRTAEPLRVLDPKEWRGGQREARPVFHVRTERTRATRPVALGDPSCGARKT